ncbi:Alanyl-tRNA synthetase [gamma proteobacterium HdN1]|nr:Alanyl-tRNA synthetase [gamma proteobacterium HdN1]
MKTSEIRKAFLDYFAVNGHQIVPSSSLIPGNDPTLLFTNAGMVQFKDVFLGRDARDYRRATTSQRCVRAGGKHNDLENVGYTARHHTFFEMLGNFSFGDYFKPDAIRFAWEFLTGERWLKLPKEKLWVTVYATDDEAYDIWTQQVGVPVDRVVRIGDNKGAPYASDNFWQMGDTGPCGPCTEIFYDHGEEIFGGPPGSKDEDGDRYIEIWNIVFMQFDRHPDGTLNPLPKPSVDTGMGLERIAAVLQHVHSNYEIDLFAHLLDAVAKVTGAKDLQDKSLRVVADHIRACAFLIADGVVPSNEGRGYVLRRIMRRAIRHGNKLGAQEPFFYKLVAALAAEMGDAYPELRKLQAQIEKTILQEEEQFARTLDQGLRILEQELTAHQLTEIPGDLVFKLYDTYGFPADLTADIARERDLSLDMGGFEQRMAAQKERSQKSSQFAGNYHDALDISTQTVFSGYSDTSGQAKVEALFFQGKPVSSVSAGQDAIVVLDQTPFYAESGGQVGDVGLIRKAGACFEVADTHKQGGAHLHHGVLVSGQISVGDVVEAEVNAELRQAIRLNHSATHLLHAALRQVLGEHVHQKGSMVTAGRLRFDFSNPSALSPAELEQIERIVNDQVRGNSEIITEIMPIDQARAKGAMALFGEKYEDEVRVLTMGTDCFSVELCGGTHARRTGDIGLFQLISEGGVAAGVRRIEAVTGAAALALITNRHQQLVAISSAVKGNDENVVGKVTALVERVRQLEKELEKQSAQRASRAGEEIISQSFELAGVKVLAAVLENQDTKALREMCDKLRDKLGDAIVVLGASQEGKVNLVAGVSKTLSSKVKAGDLVNHVASQVGGKGGGRPDMATAGGSQPENLGLAIASVRDWLATRLG